MRPHELPAIKRIYSPYCNNDNEETKTMSHDQYGEWVLWKTNTKIMTNDEYKDMFKKLTEMSME